MEREGGCPIAQRLLAEVQAAQAALVNHTEARDGARRALAGLYEALAAGVADLAEDQILASPSPDEWSMAEVLEHVAEHDGKYAEFERLGLDHYVEHGLEHALQLWRLRSFAIPPDATAMHPTHDGPREEGAG